MLIGDARCAQSLNQRLGLGLQLVPETTASASDRFLLADLPSTLDEQLPQGSADAACASVEWVREGARRCLAGKLDGLITAPVNKEAIVRAGMSFVGQTELLSQMAATERTAMMLLGTDDRSRWLRVALATTHVPLRDVSAKLTIEKVQIAIELSARACQDLGLARARIGVCGLNPHAGEGGKNRASKNSPPSDQPCAMLRLGVSTL